ncbi:MAG: hypothetical protein PVG30_05945 [Gammaproteobacteria bacterium]|jgi:hypothetical protein
MIFINRDKFLSFCFKSFLVLCGLIALFFALNLLVTAMPLHNYKNHIKQAFVGGDLTPSDHGGFDSFRGQHQYEDCLILQEGLKLSPSFLQNAINGPKYGLEKCQSLQTLALGDKKNTPKGTSFFSTGKEYLQYINSVIPDKPILYYQYLHGPRTLAVFSVSLAPLRIVRFAYQNTIYMLIFVISLYILLAKQFIRPRNIVFAVVFFIIFSFFHGVNFFGMNLTHGPGDIIVFVTFLLLLIFLNKENKQPFLYTLIVSGAFTAYFEHLVGILPGVVCMASIATFLYHFAAGLDFKDALKIFAVGTLCIFAGFLITYFSFIIVKILFTGYSWQMFHGNFGLRVSREVNQNPINYLNAIKMVWSEIYWIAGGNRTLARFMTMFAFFGMIGVGILNLIKPKIISRKNNYNTTVALALLVWVIVAFWYFIFENHTTIHPWFMDRLVSFPILSGIVVLFGYIVDALQNKYKT